MITQEDIALLKPKYVNDEVFIYADSTVVEYPVGNLIVCKTGTYDVQSRIVFRPSEVGTNSILAPDNCSKFRSIQSNTLRFETISITEDMYSFFNSVVSAGLSPLDMGNISIINGDITITYFNLSFAIKYTGKIDNKAFVYSSNITFNTIWFLYVLCREFKTKKANLDIEIASNVTIASKIYSIIKCNDIYILQPTTSFDNLFYKTLCESFSGVSESTIENFNCYTKKGFTDSVCSSVLLKHLFKCISDEFNVYNSNKYYLISSENITMIIGK